MLRDHRRRSVLQLVEGREPSARESEHRASCTDCEEASEVARQFEHELLSATRELASGRLPDGTIPPQGARRSWRWLPLAGGVALAAIVGLAIMFGPGPRSVTTDPDLTPGVGPVGLFVGDQPVRDDVCVGLQLTDAAYRDNDVQLWWWVRGAGDCRTRSSDVVAAVGSLRPSTVPAGAVSDAPLAAHEVRFGVRLRDGGEASVRFTLLTEGPEGDTIRALGGDGQTAIRFQRVATIAPLLALEASPSPSPHPADRRDAAWTVAGGALYYFGGRMAGQAVASATTFDTRTWQTLPDLPAARMGAVAVAVPDGRIYVLGGRDERGALLDTVLVFDPRTATWSRGPDMPDAQAPGAAAVADGHLYLFGGESPNHATDVWVLELASGMWRVEDPMPPLLAPSAAAVVEGAIYLFGTHADQTDLDIEVYRYLPDQPRWEQLATAPLPARDPSTISATIVDGHIWVIGARQPTDGRYLAPMAFDPRDGTWAVAPWDPETRGPPNALGWHAALPLADGRIFLVSGFAEGAVTTIVDTTLP
jgi:N-acetylneuraminic acid mutarotase